MKMVVSNRLLSLLETSMNVKVNGDSYLVKLVVDYYDCNNVNTTFDCETSEFNYFCFNKHSKITCWPTSKGEQPLNEQGQWKLEGRQEIKPGRFLLLLSSHLRIYSSQGSRDLTPIMEEEVILKTKTRACEVFADTIRGLNTPLEFDVSTDIKSIYETPEHDQSGYLKNSCMREDSDYGCRNFSGFYNTLSDLKIVYKKVGGELLFRALLWENLKSDKFPNPITFLDRIYGSDSLNIRLIEYAKEHGWAWRSFGDNRIQYGENTDVFVKKILSPESVEFLNDAGGPYVDTLSYLRSVGNKYILTNEYANSKWSIQDCDGDPLNIFTKCHQCGERIHNREEFSVDDNVYCERCYNALFRTCDDCEEEHLESEMVNLGEKGWFCMECVENQGVRQCYECQHWEDEGNMITYEDVQYCPSCWERIRRYCPVCKTWHPKVEGHRNTVVDDTFYEFVCNHCWESVVHCHHCNKNMSGFLKLTTGHGWWQENVIILCDKCTSQFTEEKHRMNEVNSVEGCDHNCPICPDRLSCCRTCDQMFSPNCNCNDRGALPVYRSIRRTVTVPSDVIISGEQIPLILDWDGVPSLNTVQS